jgi:hypothetical protein
MRLHLHFAVAVAVSVAGAGIALAQAPASFPAATPAQSDYYTRTSNDGGFPSQAQPGAAQPERRPDLQKQVDILQKQIETQQKMIQLLMDQVKKGPAGGTEKLEAQTATLEAREKQGALRDQELASALDTVVEHQDSVERFGPRLPSQLYELFLPSGNNETPLTISGALAFGYSKFQQQNGGFYFGEFTPDFLIKLNDWILLEAEIGVGGDGSVNVGSFAQVDFFVNDWLTVIGGRFVAPIGWFNERLNNPWINKLPGDAPGSGPILWQQVLPAMALLGVQAQGSFYLGCSPFKLEYNAYVSNSLNLTPATAGAPTLSELANLENMESTFTSFSNDPIFGGRIGLWWPAMGLAAGVSAMTSGNYVVGGSEDAINLWAFDFNYHKGNWDFRFEYGQTYQQAAEFIGANIRREGMYTQLAYRPRDASNPYLRNVELVYRYCYADFPGIDANQLDLTTFGTPTDVPIRRQQNEIGIDYYFYPRLVLKAAYQINDEPGFHLHDNQFLTELAWGW